MRIIKKTAAVILCIAVSAAVYLYCGMVFTPKDAGDSGGALYYNGMGFMAEPKNSLDLIMYGNSDVYSGFSPAVLKERYGYDAYASGRARQNLADINTLLDKTLETQRPGLVILETDCFFEKRSWGIHNFNSMIPAFIFHSRWKELKPRDFYQRPDLHSKVDINKGYIYSDVVAKTNIRRDYMGNIHARPQKIPNKNREMIERFISTCREKEIPVLLMELPSPHSWNCAKHNAVKKLADSYGLDFIDLNAHGTGYEIDFDRDFRDNGNHMNHNGATKATSYIGRYVREKYGDMDENMMKTLCNGDGDIRK